jgi:ATP-binding cassette subfamily C protein
MFLTAGSDPSRVLNFAGLQIPAINNQTLPWAAGAVLLLFLLKALLSVILTKRAAYFVAKVEARAARTIAEICFGGDLVNTRKQSREEVTYAIQEGSPAAFNALLNSVNTFMTEAVLFLVICLGFLFVDPMSTIAAVVYFGLVSVIIQYFVGSQMSKAGLVNAKGSVKANTAVADLFSVFRELLVLGRRSAYIDRIFQARVHAAESTATTYYLNGIQRYVIEATLLVGIALFGLAQALSGDIANSAGKIAIFLSGGFRLIAALLPLQTALLTIKSVIPLAKSAQEILTSVPSATKTEKSDLGNLSIPRNRQLPIRVKVNKVNFSYPQSQKPTIDGISFEIGAGAQVALVGKSGAGKSTIADLICGVIAPSSGTIALTDSNDSFGSAIRGRISYVPQKPGLVAGTIANNVALAVECDEVDRHLVVNSLRLANLADVVEELPEGIDTSLGNLQDALSGGQLQRLGLARALYSEPGLLIMDEATSGLDAESESEIQKALDNMRGKVTVLLIAHKLNTIQHADKVILVEDGKIKDEGKFQEIVTRNPGVARAVNLMQVDKD